MVNKDKKELYNLIKQGALLTDKNNMAEIYVSHRYIKYRNYGSSAVKLNYKNFTWVIDVIFKGYKVNDFVIDTSSMRAK